MMTMDCELNVEVIEALEAEIRNKKLPLHVQEGIMLRESESDTLMMPVQIDYPDDFDLNETLCEVINKTYNLK